MVRLLLPLRARRFRVTVGLGRLRRKAACVRLITSRYGAHCTNEELTLPLADREPGARANQKTPVIVQISSLHKATFLGAFLAIVAVLSGCGTAPLAKSHRRYTQPAHRCDRFASTSGSDRAAGTIGHPYRTVQRLVNSLSAGKTGCLRGGVYDEDVVIKHGGTATAPMVIRSYSTATATLVGRLYLARGARYTTISDMKLVGINHSRSCEKICPSPFISANDTTFVRDDVTNNHVDAICFLLGDANGVYGAADHTIIKDNRIHDCGKLPPSNFDHGIYIEESRGSQILDNLIYDNADRGIQLYPHAIGTLIRGNVIVANGEGVDFGGGGSHTSSDNIVEHNIIANSKVLYNVLSAYGAGASVGTGNLVRYNCIGGGAMDNNANPGGIRFSHVGFTLSANLLAVPHFADPAHGDYTLAAGSACRGILPFNRSQQRERGAGGTPSGVR